jgi:uncharacterized lipoprotein (TIGR02269 family)
MRAWVLLLCGLLTACASTTPTERRWERAEAVTAECDDPGADRCTALFCGVRACGLYRCEDVRPGRIVHAQAVAPLPPPVEVEPLAEPFPTSANPQRYWGSMQGLPRDAEAILIIPWDQAKPAAQSRDEDKDQDKRVWVKHHIFPQEFKTWFDRKGINIHSLTMVLEKPVHERIHRGVSGGPWNAAWRQYIKGSDENVSAQAIRLFAAQLIARFGLIGPLQPYYRATVIPGIPTEEETY